MKRVRAPQQTRKAVLDAAFQAVWRQGFQAASLNDILARTGLTKGAFYHHFPDKFALGRALVEERLTDYVQDLWLTPMEVAVDPLAEMAQIVERHLLKADPAALRLGCPLAALAQDLGGLDDGFRGPLETLHRAWRKGVARALRQGQQRGAVRSDIDAEHVAAFIIAAWQGILAMARATPNGVAEPARALLDYIGALRG